MRRDRPADHRRAGGAAGHERPAGEDGRPASPPGGCCSCSARPATSPRAPRSSRAPLTQAEKSQNPQVQPLRRATRCSRRPTTTRRRSRRGHERAEHRQGPGGPGGRGLRAARVDGQTRLTRRHLRQGDRRGRPAVSRPTTASPPTGWWAARRWAGWTSWQRRQPLRRAGDRQHRGRARQARRRGDGEGQPGRQLRPGQGRAGYDYNYFSAHQADPAQYPWNEELARPALPAPSTSSGSAGWTGRLKPGQERLGGDQGVAARPHHRRVPEHDLRDRRSRRSAPRWATRSSTSAGAPRASPLRPTSACASSRASRARRSRGGLHEVNADDRGHVRAPQRQDRRLGVLLQPPEVPAQAPGRRLAGRERRLYRRRRRRQPALHRAWRGGQDRGGDGVQEMVGAYNGTATATTT